MSTFQIRATVHASANSPTWTHFTTSARLSVSARKPPIRFKDTQKSEKYTVVRSTASKDQLSIVNNNEGTSLPSLQSAVVTDSPFEINNIENKETISQRIESGSQLSSTSLSRFSTSPLPFDDDENMPPQDFIAHNQGYMYFYYIFNFT